MRTLSIFIEGKPVPQGSMTHVGQGHMIHKPALIEWRNKITAFTLDMATRIGFPWGYDGPIIIKAKFIFERPKNTKFNSAPYGNPDLDKLMRAVGDALAPRKGPGLLKDDSQIIAWHAEKRWATEVRRLAVGDAQCTAGLHLIVEAIEL